MVDVQAIIDKGVDMTMAYLPKVLLALLTLIIGLKVIKWLVRLSDKGMKKKKVDLSLRHFFASLISIGLKVILVISVISMLGVATTSFIAVLGAAGLAIGLALQGSLANFAGGVLILLFKPFEVGHVIDAQGYIGKVQKIQIFNTIMNTPDNKRVIIPNGVLSNGPISNVTVEDTRRVDFAFGIGYDDDIKKASKILTKIAESHKLALKDPAPQIRVKELADSSVNFTVRIWTKTENYWDVYFDVMEEVKMTFDKEGVSIPYPQMDVHMQK